MRMIAAPTLRTFCFDVVACIVIVNIARLLGMSSEDGAYLVAFLSGGLASDAGYFFEGYFNAWRNRNE